MCLDGSWVMVSMVLKKDRALVALENSGPWKRFPLMVWRQVSVIIVEQCPVNGHSIQFHHHLIII